MYLSVGNGTASNRSMLIGYARYGAVWVVCTVVNLVVIARSCVPPCFTAAEGQGVVICILQSGAAQWSVDVEA